MATKYLNKYRNETTRIKNFDYGSNASYFITINTLNQKNFFGEIVRTDDCPSSNKNENINMGLPVIENAGNNIRTDNRPSLQMTEMGKIAEQYWIQIPEHYPWVELDVFVIMPNHIHGIICINKPEINGWNPNTFGPQSKNLGSIIRAFKSSVKRYSNINQIEFDWQPRYFDVLINNDRELNNIRNYIYENPIRWLEKSKNNS